MRDAAAQAAWGRDVTPQELVGHKRVTKIMSALPTFKPMKRNKWPKPFHRMGGPRVQATEIISVSDTHRVMFLWRDGELRTDSCFYAYLLCELSGGALGPVLEFHLHPSHKGIHCKVPCGTSDDYTNRLLPNAPELSIDRSTVLDPRNEVDRTKLIAVFCDTCGITVRPKTAPDGQYDLWGS
jgi:hypothetical protein